jgi:hypothetical protein
MSGGMTLSDLHLAIQATIGWEIIHLHAFEIGDRRFGDRVSWMMSRMKIAGRWVTWRNPG